MFQSCHAEYLQFPKCIHVFRSLGLCLAILFARSFSVVSSYFIRNKSNFDPLWKSLLGAFPKRPVFFPTMSSRIYLSWNSYLPVIVLPLLSTTVHKGLIHVYLCFQCLDHSRSSINLSLKEERKECANLSHQHIASCYLSS